MNRARNLDKKFSYPTMPLPSRPSQASSTFYGQVTPVTTRNSNRSKLPCFRALPSYPSPQRRREITTEASSSSFRTSYVLRDDSDTDSDDSTGTDVSCEFLKRNLLRKGNFKIEESSDSDSESVQSSTITNLSYSPADGQKPKVKQPKEAFVFISEGSGPVTCISAARAGQAWVCRNYDKRIYLYHKNGHKKESRTLNAKMDTLCLRQDGAVLVIPHLSHSVCKMSPVGKLSDFILFELAPSCVFCTSRNETLVTTMHVQKSQKKGPKPRKRPSILRLSQAGVAIWEIKSKGTDPLAKPSRVTVNRNGDICVIDLEQFREHVVLFTPDGSEKRRYYGVQNKVLTQRFDPKDICCDSKGNVYIADLHNSAVHVLDKNGYFSHFLVTKDDGVSYPSALTCDSDGCVWVGFSSGEIRVYNVDSLELKKT